MVLSLTTAVVTKLYYQGSAYLPLADLVVKRQKAKMLALGGIQMAISKLAGPQVAVRDDDKKDQPKTVAFLERILPCLNRWEMVKLTEENDGIDGSIKICVSCENGKINLNSLYDFQKHEFQDAANTAQQKEPATQKKMNVLKMTLREVLDQLGQLTKGEIDSAKAFSALCRFLEERKYPIIDVTELLQIKEFSYFSNYVFYAPPVDDDQNLGDQARPVYLTDIFTSWTDTVQLQPWLLSDSILAILGFPRAQPDDIMRRERAVSSWIKEFKDGAQWVTEWDKTLGKMYDTSVGAIPKEALALFDIRFNPSVFGVLSYGTVAGVTQKIYAIVKMQSKDKDKSFFTIEKLYWI